MVAEGPGTAGIPRSLRTLIAARLDQLPAEAKALSQAAAVIGDVFWEEAVAALIDGTVTTASGFALLETRGVIDEEATSSFPGGRQFLYDRIGLNAEYNGTYLGSLDAKPEQQSTRRFLTNAFGAVFVPAMGRGSSDGHLLFTRDGSLMAQPFDLRRGEAAGEPVYGMEERPVPQTVVPGEVTSKTQPFPLKPPPLGKSPTHRRRSRREAGMSWMVTTPSSCSSCAAIPPSLRPRRLL
jgi:hypothetical protein